ncbi:hypothetical protein [Dactylosporangium salmoneum]|uniref:Fibronectin type-III domain-containing protein n=1 Tax=Dactylosporangium salmoneum TaxID=53361 RepID=A0ABN3FKF0_9ACTN
MPDFDQGAYLRVLERARAAGAALPDLAVRYALDPATPRPDRELDEHLAAVRAFWRSVQTGPGRYTYGRLIQRMLVEHDQVVDALGTPAPGRGRFEAFLELRDRQLDRYRDRLAGEIRRRAGDCAVMTPADLQWLVRFAEGAYDLAGVRARAEAEGIVVREPRGVRPAVPPEEVRSLRRSVGQLSLDLSIEVVYGRPAVADGFTVLDGFALTRPGAPPLDLGLIEARQRDAARLGHQQTITAPTRDVLAILAAAARRGELGALLLAEVVQAVLERAHDRLELGVLAAAGAGLGLRRDEAGWLAVSLQADPGITALTGAARVEAALADGDLRRAETLAARLSAGAETERLRAEVAERGATVLRLTAEASDHLAAGRTEAAAERLHRAADLARDDAGVRSRLGRIPPPPPTGVAAVPRPDGTVVIAWKASRTLFGDVTYRVERATAESVPAAGRGALVAAGPACEAADPAVPVAVPLRYAVFAARDGESWSAPALSDGLVATPEVADAALTVGPHAVTGSWRPDPAVLEVLVSRGSGGPPTHGVGARVDARRDGFIDRDLAPRRRYYYRISACYLVGERRIVSPGHVLTAEIAPPPVAVGELSADVREQAGRTVVRVLWQPPPAGQVLVYATPAPPPLARAVPVPATELAAAMAAARGAVLGGVTEALPGGWERLTAPIETGRRIHLTAVTVSGEWAAAGPAAEVIAVPGVRGLEAVRQGERAQLTWVWPERCDEARVVWWADGPAAAGPPRGELLCSHSVYRQRNGVALDVGPEAVRIAVEARVATPDGVLSAPAATTRLPAAPDLIRYAMQHRVVRRQVAVTFRFTTLRACELPPFVIVQSSAEFLPDRPDQGRIVHRAQTPVWLRPGITHVVNLQLPAAGPRPFWLVCMKAPGVDSPVRIEPESRMRLQVT